MGGDIIKGFIGLGGVVIIVGVVNIIKDFINDTRWYPLIAVFFGIILNIVAAWSLNWTARVDIFAAVMQGFIVGLSASGLYSTVQTFREGTTARKDNPAHII